MFTSDKKTRKKHILYRLGKKRITFVVRLSNLSFTFSFLMNRDVRITFYRNVLSLFVDSGLRVHTLSTVLGIQKQNSNTFLKCRAHRRSLYTAYYPSNQSMDPLPNTNSIYHSY